MLPHRDHDINVEKIWFPLFCFHYNHHQMFISFPYCPSFSSVEVARRKLGLLRLDQAGQTGLLRLNQAWQLAKGVVRSIAAVIRLVLGSCQMLLMFLMEFN